MDIIRRNTDYALRLMVNLAEHYGNNPVSSRVLAEKEEVSYQLTCKLLQRLSASGLVKSQMGPKGGYSLDKPPSEISLEAIVNSIQGRISVNSCMFGLHICSKQPHCPINEKLSELQQYMEHFFSDITLDKLLKIQTKKKKNM